MMAWEKRLQNELSSIRGNEPMSRHTTLGVGGPAQYFYVAESIEDLVKAASAARNTGAPFRVIGNGSNLIVSDRGIEGLTIVNRSKGLQIDKTSGRVIAESGVPLSRMILEAANSGLGGLEPLYGIPGTVGGAVVNNAGAHGASIAQFLRSSSVMTTSDKILNAKNDWFKFSYRASRLKGLRSSAPPVVLNAIFQLQQRKGDDALADVAKYKKWREKHQPVGERTCGSIFKNPGGESGGLPPEKTAGYLLDQAQAKKMRVGPARVSKIHANWVVVTGEASSWQIRQLIEKMREAVNERFTIILQEEVEYLGSWDETDAKQK